jgi:peptidyl-prolyl cis-trans isomerase D
MLAEAKKDIDSGSSFEGLVKEISEDEGTKEMDGSLGVTDGTLLPPEFESALEKMTAGEVSDPINLLNSVHLLKLVSIEQPTPSPLEDRKSIIIERLASEKAEDEYFELLDQVSELSFTAGNLDEIAETIPFSKIELDFFSENNTPEVLNTAAIKDFIFNVSEEGDYPELFESEGLKAVMVQVKENIAETQLTLDQVKDKVTKDYIDEESLNLSQLFVADQLGNLNEGSSLEVLATNDGLELENYKKLKRDSSLLPSNAIDNIFALPRSGVGSVHSSVNMSNGDLILYRLDEVKSGQTDLDTEQMANLSNFLNQQKSLAELSEIQLSLQNSLKIERFN